jgi:hypothetical protein
MNDRLDQVLSAQLGELLVSTGEPDWGDVRRRARSRRRTRRAKLGAAAALAALVVLAATPALGLRGHIVQLFGSGEPAPAKVETSFAQMDIAAPPGMAPGVIAGETREVARFPLSTGKTTVLWVAPTRSGGFCFEYSNGGAGCDRDRQGNFAPGLAIPGIVAPPGEIQKPPVLVTGETLLHDAASVEVQFEDGDVAKVPLVWVSPPIDAGFFLYDLPSSHLEVGHLPSALVLQDTNGHELARDTQIARSLREVREHGLPHEG